MRSLHHWLAGVSISRGIAYVDTSPLPGSPSGRYGKSGGTGAAASTRREKTKMKGFISRSPVGAR